MGELKVLKLSVFTPTHNAKYLREAYHSLLAQTYGEWEWIIVPNGGVKIPQEIRLDPHVKMFPLNSNSVGELKAYACAQATGQVLVEFDHDDMLLPTCLEEVALAAVDHDFIYSNCIQVNQDWTPHLWGDAFGWEWRDVTYEGHEVKEAVSPEPYPSNFSRIWFAPNHVRAWRKDFYERIGGHDKTLNIGDDHDLCARSYLEGRIKHIDKPLYLYRVHGENSWLKMGDEIETTMWNNHDKYFIPMQEKWAREQELRIVDLGGAIGCPEGYESYDRHNADIVGDLNNDWHLGDNSVGLLRAHDAIEHFKDPIHTMNEAHRVLAHGGVFDVLVPSTDGVGAFCDPTHVSYWNYRSFRYYTEAGMRSYIEPECTAKFQVVKIANLFMWEGIPYVQAQMIALKDGGMRYHGVCEW